MSSLVTNTSECDECSYVCSISYQDLVAVYNTSLLSTQVTPTVQQNATQVGSDLQWMQAVLPVICTLGVTGNILNLVVLGKKRIASPMRKLERSANLGLVALALSDLLFNLAVFPHYFVQSAHLLSEVLYQVYGMCCINLFLMTSNWLILLLALERYIVLYQPLKAKHFLCLSRAKLLIILVYLFSVLITLPYFLYIKVHFCPQADGSTRYITVPRFSGFSEHVVRVYMRWIWPIIAVFIPLPVLSFCNVRLVQGLKRVPNKRVGTNNKRPKNCNNRITLTLVVIVFMAIILVTPAEIVKFINPYAWGRVGHIIASASNILQAVNFAFNFVLYCTLDSTFRSACHRMFLVGCKTKAKTESQMVFLRKNGTGSTLKGPLHAMHTMHRRGTARTLVLPKGFTASQPQHADQHIAPA